MLFGPENGIRRLFLSFGCVLTLNPYVLIKNKLYLVCGWVRYCYLVGCLGDYGKYSVANNLYIHNSFIRIG